ncbi:cell wall-binding repeat-containing protein [Agromyces aurantiacus]|uniref:Cell wall-binding repeat-containing protein n=1 Tax=Agromyces aurantiacus TaxID=165814 RepID=A0ABV9R5H7_9MICO
MSGSALAALASVSDRAASRDAGADRYATAVDLSTTHFPDGATDVWLATGENFPDGITASAIAGARAGPVLLTRTSTLPSNVSAELIRLHPANVWVTGGTGAVTEGVVAAVRQALPGAEVVRLAGADRYGTAAALAQTFVASADSVFVASGLNFPDALSTGPAAADGSAPILLVSTSGVPSATAAQLRRLRPATVYAVGGTGVVADSVLSSIRSITGGQTVRVAGADRFATAAAVSDRFFEPTTASILVANAFSFADGIAAGAVAGLLASPLLLADAHATPPRVTVDASRRVSWWLPASGRVIRYTLVTHPDDEFAAWSVLGDRDPRRYDVVVVLTTGESTSYCNGEPVDNPWMSQQFLPQPQPTGEQYSDRCKKHRMDSWNVFMESAGFTGTSAPETLTAHPQAFGGRAIPVPLRRDATGQVIEAASYQLAVGPVHAVVAFDMGALTSDEVLWAILTARELAVRFPTQVEGDIVAAGFYNDGPTGYRDIHPDHDAVYTLLGTVDLGLPGSQYQTVGHAQAARAFGATVSGYCGMMCHPAAPSPFRGPMGRFQYAYGWLANGYWPPGEADQPAGFSHYQSFSKWF